MVITCELIAGPSGGVWVLRLGAPVLYRPGPFFDVPRAISVLRTMVGPVLQEFSAEDKPFWLTETGWATNDTLWRAVPAKEDSQAACYAEMCDSVVSSGLIDKIFFYEFRDDSHFRPKFGLLHSDMSPKPAYQIYRNFVRGHGE